MIENNMVFRKLSLCLIALFFITAALKSLVTGGRWDLNEQIAFAYRISDGIISYCNGITDLFFPSSPYFPGVGFLSYFYKILGIDDIFLNNQLMIITAVLIGILFFILIFKLTKKIYSSIPTNIIFVLGILLLIFNFRSCLDYMIEFKPDTILLVVGLTSIFLFESNKKPTFLKYFIAGVLLFFVSFFKQSSFLIYLLIFILIISNKYIGIKEKVIVLSTYLLIGLSFLFLLFNIDNLYYFTIEITSEHSIQSFKSIAIILYLSIRDNLIFLLGLLYFLLIKSKEKKINSLELKYFIFCIFWFIFSLVSAMKSGGNSGNIEVGLIVFLPFVIYALNNFFKDFYKIKKFNLLVMISLILLIIFYSLLFCKLLIKYNDEINKYHNSTKYLSENFKNKRVYVGGDTFIMSKKAGLKVISEGETALHIYVANKLDIDKIKNAYNSNIYDIIFVGNKYLVYFDNKEILNAFEHNYKLLEDQNMPSYLKGKIFVPREDK